jgi:peptidoglycan/xylan/chitin deacetylase (PgdA/CDA1 family)
MDSSVPEGPSQGAVARWALLLALVLPAAAVLGAVAQGKDRSDSSVLWQLRAQAPVSGAPLLSTRWYPSLLPAAGARRDTCPRPRHRPHRHGPRGRRLVALTFDDGPSLYTPSVLRALRRAHARATFFVVGIHIAGREPVLRRAVTAGDEIGDHSWDHPPLPSHWQLHRTGLVVRRAAGVRPCLFRPPYGLVDRRLLRAAASLRMTTVEWDVDTSDWAGLRPKQIAKHVLRAVRPGSIVLMHDGGGVRSRTVKALPRILRGLRRRGYRTATVSRLLER